MASFSLFEHVDLRTTLLGVIIIFALCWFLGRRKNLPPGPRGLPFIGSLVAIARGMRSGLQPHDIFIKYAAQFGPVFHLRILNKDVVVLNDYASIKEAFQHPQLNDRPRMILGEIYSAGVGLLSGNPWVEMHRFSLNVLRSFGVGKSIFEEQIGTEAKELIKEFSASDGKPFDPKPLLGNAVSNVICAVVFGKRYEYTDEDFKRLLGILEQNFKLYGAGGGLLYFPLLRYVPFIPVIRKLVSNRLEMKRFLLGVISNHRVTFDADNVNDFIGVYLKEMKDTMEKDNSEAKRNEITEGRFLGTVSDIFEAGSDTTATTLQWCLLYMIVHPDVQKRVQDEIDAVVGRDRLPRMADKPDLHLTRAVIWEVQRLTMIAPLGVAHAAASDTRFRGFVIPKGAFLFANLWSVGRDPHVWREPDEFKPERFLNDQGEAVAREELIPFAIGRRSCLGENLAKMELFVFFTYFMHQFTFKTPEDAPPLSLEGVPGLTYSPKPFKLCAIKRD